MDERDRVWVKARSSEMLVSMHLGKKGFVGFEEGHLLITWPYDDIPAPPSTMKIKVKGVSRKDPITIIVTSGFWDHGHVTLTFDSKEDADKTELQLREIIIG